MYAISFNSSSLSGAEKRALKIARTLESEGYGCVVIVNRSTENAIKSLSYNFDWSQLRVYDEPFAYRFFKKGKKHPKIRKILLFDFFESVFSRAVKNNIKKIIKNNNISLVHVFLDFSILKLFDCLRVFEVTSPDVAKVITINPSLIGGSIALHSVSQNVTNILQKAGCKNHILTSKLPFVDVTLDESGIREKRNVIVFAHRYIDRKNPILFAKAVKRFFESSDTSDWKVLFRGRGPLEFKIKAILKKEIEQELVDISFNSNLIEDLCLSKIFVSLIEPDNYPSQSIFEAMCCQNALLLSNTGQTVEKFYNGNGCVCELSEDDIYFSLINMIKDESLIAHYGLRSQQVIVDQYSKDKYISDLIDFYALVRMDTFQS